MEGDALPCPFISIKNAATATLPTGIAMLKKKTVIQVKRRKLRNCPASSTIVILLPSPWRIEITPKHCVTAVSNYQSISRRSKHATARGPYPSHERPNQCRRAELVDAKPDVDAQCHENGGHGTQSESQA